MLKPTEYDALLEFFDCLDRPEFRDHASLRSMTLQIIDEEYPMRDPLRGPAKQIVMAGSLIAAAWHFVCSLALAALGLWLASIFHNWFAWGLSMLLGLESGYLLVKAGHEYLSARPELRPDQRERFLRSRSLYIPEDRRREPQREHSHRRD